MSPQQPQDHKNPGSGQPQRPPEQIDYSKPVAYDTNGRPLYAHPPQETQWTQQMTPPVVQAVRPFEPAVPHVSEEAKARHEKSTERFPKLNLSDGEYVISAVHRHPVGMFSIFAGAGLVLVGLVVAVGMYANFVNGASAASGFPPVAATALIALLLGVLICIGAFIAHYVYMQNRFFLTNESVIQEIQHSVFSKREQTVSLGNIEDASYRQQGIIQHFFNYGSIRLSTEGDETTYRFHYVSNPKKQIAILNNAVEDFKNGRPVTGRVKDSVI